MNPVEEIRNYFSSLNEGKIIQLNSFNINYPCWVVKLDNSFGVALEIDSKFLVNERFSNARYYSNTFEIEGITRHLLLFTSNAVDLRYEFASLCAIFLDPGIYGEERKAVTSNPIEWWKNFKELIGNKTYEKTVHSVLGELITFYYLYSLNHEVKWNGPGGSTVDIEDEKNSYEVKSTIMRYDSIVEISSQYQLINKNQYLFFCRFEKSQTGISIDKLVGLITNLGYSEDDIQTNLNKLGFEKNSIARAENYRLHEFKKYIVDGNFPVIRIDKVVEEKFLDHIVQLKYKIDLKGLTSENIKLDFE